MSEYVERVRESAAFKAKYLREKEHEEMLKRQAHREDAIGMKAEGISLDVIHRVTGLPFEMIEAL